jgi:hypothetical protein
MWGQTGNARAPLAEAPGFKHSTHTVLRDQLPPRFCVIFSTAWSMLKLAARWRGG